MSRRIGSFVTRRAGRVRPESGRGGERALVTPVLLLSVLSILAAEPAAARQIPHELRTDSIFAPFRDRAGPGCAVGVMRDGVLTFASGYGSANLEHDVPITPSSIFHVASISKQFTAFAIALLAQEGRLSLDDEVRQHVAEVPDFGARITIRHLIHHTSGMRDQWELLSLSGWRADDPKSEADILWLVGRQRELNFPPGSEHLYSNTGYTLLGTIVHRVSGQPLREFLDARVFQPLGMTSTHVHDDHSMIVPGRTSAYVARGGSSAGDGFAISIPVFDNAGATSLFTTVEDLAKWERNLRDGTIGGSGLVELLHTRGRLNDGSAIPYAFALTHGQYRGLRTVGHSGADAGYRADFLRFPEEGFAFATLCNLASANPSQLNRQVADVWLGGRMGPVAAPAQSATPAVPEGRGNGPDAAALHALAGHYHSEELDVIWTVAVDGAGLVVRRRRFPDRAAQLVAADRVRSANWELQFTRDAAGRIGGFRLTTGRVRNLRFVRLP